jgi:predicted dehydrogenase
MGATRMDDQTGNFSCREFLKTTGIVGAGLVLAPTLLSAETPPPSDDLNVAIIGCGTQGLILLEQAVKIPGVRFRAVCDIWPYSQKYGAGRLKMHKHTVNVYADYQDMLAKEKDLQAAIVASPDWMHAEHTIACMKAGLHVYCEAPISNDLAQARQMAVMAQEMERFLQIGQQRRSDPRYLLCRDRFMGEGGVLGRITHAYSQWNIPLGDDTGLSGRLPENRTVYSHRNASGSGYGLRRHPKGQDLDTATLTKYGYDTMDRFRDWRWYKKFGGGPLMELGAAQIDVMTWLLGSRPSAVMASGGTDFFTQYGWEWPDNAFAICDFPTPQGLVRATYQFQLTNGAGRHFETFMGTDGTLEISEIPEHFRFCPDINLTGTDPTDPIPLWKQYVKKGMLKVVDYGAEFGDYTYYVGDYLVIPSERADGFPLLSCKYSEGSRFYCEPVDAEAARDPRSSAADEGLTPHLRNFFDTLRGKATLNCPAQVGYATTVQVLKIYEAMAAGKKMSFEPQDFKV